MEYSWSLNSFKDRTYGTPNGNLLIGVDNINKLSDGLPYAYTLDIEIAQFKPGARFQFNKADVVVETGMTG